VSGFSVALLTKKGRQHPPQLPFWTLALQSNFFERSGVRSLVPCITGVLVSRCPRTENYISVIEYFFATLLNYSAICRLQALLKLALAGVALLELELEYQLE
jgi:hypothetical protein